MKPKPAPSPETSRLANQRGVTIIEQVITLAFIGLAILAWLLLFKVATRGALNSKHSLRAQNVATSKLEEFKNAATALSQAGAWYQLTQNARINEFTTPQIVTFTARTFTWSVTYTYVNVGLAGGPVASQTPTDMISATARVNWLDVVGPAALSLTVYVTDQR